MVKIENEGQKDEPHFLIRVAMDFKFHDINVCIVYISYWISFNGSKCFDSRKVY